MIRLEPGDMLSVIPRLVAEGGVCDAVVTDPPYHLLPLVKRSAPGVVPVQPGKDGSFARLQGGFMGQTWDGGDIAFRAETWATVATILRPGALLIAFGGTRTYHRLVTAIEDAGFIIQDQVAWLFGSGFPKRRDMLKPAFEPICLAYKPGGKRTLQVDECRIGTESTIRPFGAQAGTRENGCGHKGNAIGGSESGRWPANVCHDGSEEVIEAFPESAGQLFRVKEHERKSNNVYGKFAHNPETNPRGDTGSAARFFYCAKAGSEDRFGSRHPTVKPVELMKWLVALVTPRTVDGRPGLCLDPFAGSGTTGVAALATGRDCILIEREDQYIADIKERLAFYEGGGAHSVQAKNRSRQADSGPLFA